MFGLSHSGDLKCLPSEFVLYSIIQSTRRLSSQETDNRDARLCVFLSIFSRLSIGYIIAA